MLFQVSYDRFIEEITHEKLTAGGKDKLELEDLGDALAYYLTSFDRPKAYVFVVLKTELTDVQSSVLTPLSRPVDRRITDSSKLTSIAQSLTRIEQQLNRNPAKGVETQTVER